MCLRVFTFPSGRGGSIAAGDILTIVSGSLLRLVSMVALTAVIGMSTARVVCLLPCLFDEGSSNRTASSPAHCDHTGTAPNFRLSGAGGSCESCDSIGIADAERISSRGTILDDVIAPARASVTVLLPSTSSGAHLDIRPPLGDHASAEAPLPLRI